MNSKSPLSTAIITAMILVMSSPVWSEPPQEPARSRDASFHREIPDDPYIPVPPATRQIGEVRTWVYNGHVSVQVNVAAGGANIVGDAANEPSMAVDPTNPDRIAIGWRQFDTVTNNFRQAGIGYSDDGGATWTFPGPLDPGVFRSDPVLDADATGTFYYDSLLVEPDYFCDVSASVDGGVTWGTPVYAFGHDKQWITIDRTGGAGAGNIYQFWSPFTVNTFNRSTTGGTYFETPVAIPETPYWGTATVAPDGAVFVAGQSSAPDLVAVVRSSDAQNPMATTTFDQTVLVDLGGVPNAFVDVGPNPVGLLGQVWIASDHSGGPNQGNLYLLCSVDPAGSDPLDVHFARSTDGGATWSNPVRVNDDATGNGAWQWFGTMSVAPDGRIDAIWNDTRSAPGTFMSQLTYAFSEDGGQTWSSNEFLSPAFDPHVGWPQQEKIGDYYDMVSDETGVHIAYSATFNQEQDVYYLHLDPPQLFADGFESGDTTSWSSSFP